MKKLFALLFFTALLLPASTFAWGSKGHKIVAAIAKNCLSKQVADSVQQFLGDMSFEDAAVWMDEIKSDHQYDNMKVWHYVNVEKDKTYVKTKDPEVVNEIEIYTSVLKEKGARDNPKINFALKVLFHLVGDIHQPLHCGYKADKGGNDVKLLFMGEDSNLHKVWDSELINAAHITLNDCLSFCNALPVSEKKKMQTDDVEIWMNESIALLPDVYDFKNEITKAYIDKNKPVIEKQLVRAGLRLAVLLNETFKR